MDENDDIIQLTGEVIAEYLADGYLGDHLEPGDWVWLDDGGELYVTLDELQTRIGELEGTLRDGQWLESWAEDLEMLRGALRRLRAAASGCNE